jgi:adenylate kinase family enzyme
MKALIFGLPGSGKTTFSHRLSEATGIPIFHIDRHFFEADRGWNKRPHEDFLADVRAELAKESWLMDGNGMRSLEMRYREADLVIFCAAPRVKCFYRIFRRACAWFFLSKERSDVPDGVDNYVTLRLLKYNWDFRSKYGRAIADLQEKYPNIEFIQARSDRDLERILKKFS